MTLIRCSNCIVADFSRLRRAREQRERAVNLLYAFSLIFPLGSLHLLCGYASNKMSFAAGKYKYLLFYHPMLAS